MRHTRIFITAFLLFYTVFASAQKKSAFVNGKVVDDNETPMAGVSVVILGKQAGIITSDSGTFRIKVPAERAFALLFSYAGFVTEQRNFYLSENEEEKIVVLLEKGTKTLEEVVVTTQPERKEVGLIRINPKNALVIPSPTGGIESLIKIFVGSNNELTSQYSVRGGNYDENLIYVNDFEVFRPYLVRSGQQEGLSFINPELTGRVSFYNGGFQSHYGDKMSSVLDIQYKKPRQFGGSAYISLLEQGFHVEGNSRNQKFSYLAGIRNRSNRSLLSSQETKGSYIPTSTDIQGLLSWQLSQRWQFEVFGNLSKTKFTLIPETSQLTTSVFSPMFSANLGLDIFFEGREEDRYITNLIGTAATQHISKNIRLKWMLSRFEDDEEEKYDIIGAYLFGERDFDKSKPTFGTIINPLGAGLYQNFARNDLKIVNWNASHKGQWDGGRHYIQWGLSAEKTSINDKLNEWERQDSAGYTLPYDPGNLQLTTVVKSSADLDINKFSGYIQDNLVLNDSLGITIQAGLRFNYNSLNNELLLSPRVQFSWKPNWQKDFVFKAAAGAYHQPPFYRELRKYDGTVNTGVLAQRSWQIVLGADYQFKAWSRPFRLSTEAYYKKLTNVVPYDLDNVRIRYYGENNAKAYATGIEMRLSGELVKDAESWISLGIMRTMENLDDDHYFNYYNSNGELITSQTEDQVAVDSARVDVGWLRRPTDRLVTFGMFFQDYLSTNKNFKVHLNLLYGSNMPYNIPGSVKYRNALIIEPYIRADIGFSVLLLDSEKTNRRSHSPFRNLENIWLSLEIFNLLDRRNTISYMLIKDFSNTIFAVPQRLTPRLVNIKLLVRF
jgi:CarboxypepD_reg-like domain/TonB-dependent Receptor Plug Domain